MSLLEEGKKLVEREVIATQTQNTIIVNDGSNEASIPGYPYSFLAKGDKILVSVDIFKSGYECKECKGSGKIKSHCECEDTDRPGFKYNFHNSPQDISNAQMQMKCPKCKGDFINLRVNADCSACNGKGGLLHIPDQSKILPTTGVIVSMGPFVNQGLGLKLNDRVLFGAYVGQMIPTRAPGVAFKIIRDIEVLCQIKGGEDLAAFDFVTIDKEL